MPTKACETGSDADSHDDRETFSRQLEACLPALRARALKLCLNRAEAEDLVQDAVVRALRFQSGFTPGSNLRAWSQQVLFSVFISRCRKSNRERRALECFRMDPNAWARFNASVVTRELPPRISRALGELPEKFRSVVHLVDLNELSYREAAEALEVPVGTVMSRLFRGRRQLAQTLNEPKALDTAALDSAAEPAVAA